MVNPAPGPEKEKQPPAFDPQQPVLSGEQAVGKAVSSVWVYLGSQFSINLFLAMLGAILVVLAVRAPDYASAARTNVLFSAVTLLVVTVASGLISSIFAARNLRIRPWPRLFDFHFDWLWVFKGICLTALVNLAGGVLVSLINWLLQIFSWELDGLNLPVGSSLLSDGILFVSTVLAAPVVEELFFRGILCQSLSRYSKGFGVVFSSLLFAMMHMNLVQGIPTFLIGLVLGYVLIRSGSLSACIIIHMLNNLLAMLQELSYGNDLNAVYVMATGLFLILGLAGIFLLVRERKEIGWMLSSSAAADSLWHALSRQAGFWILLVLFLGYSLLFIF